MRIESHAGFKLPLLRRDQRFKRNELRSVRVSARGHSVLAGCAQLGVYTVERVLGSGGFGITYAARAMSGHRVALKEFYPAGLASRDATGQVLPHPSQKAEFRRLLERFVREAEVLWKLEGRFRRYLGFWEQNGTAYLAMAYFQGETLETRIAQGAKLSESEARQVMLEVLELLGVVHAQGLLHRDIKPANIVLTEDRAELIDFGSITDFNRKGVTTRLLTPEYAPLEFYGSDVQLSPASDLYSLCATIYEAVTLVKPPNAVDRMNGATVKPVRDLEPNISADFAETLEIGLELQIQERWASSTELMRILGVDTSQRGQKQSPTDRVLVGLAMLVAMALMLYSMGWKWPISEQQRILNDAERYCAMSHWECRITQTNRIVNVQISDSGFPFSDTTCIALANGSRANDVQKRQAVFQEHEFAITIALVSDALFTHINRLEWVHFQVSVCPTYSRTKFMLSVPAQNNLGSQPAQTTARRFDLWRISF